MLPLRGTSGVMSSVSSRWRAWGSSHRTPEWPRRRELILIRMAARTQDSGMVIEVKWSGTEDMTPQCCIWNSARPRPRWSCVRVLAEIQATQNQLERKNNRRGVYVPLPPKPVLTPYMLTWASSFSLRTSRLAWTRSRVDSSMTVDALCRATAITSGSDSDVPSMLICCELKIKQTMSGQTTLGGWQRENQPWSIEKCRKVSRERSHVHDDVGEAVVIIFFGGGCLVLCKTRFCRRLFEGRTKN